MSGERGTRPVDTVVDAVLYEGYMLYPYRPSSVKNRQRWTFGGVYPQAYSIAHGGTDPWVMQTECLVEGDARAVLDVEVGFLHLVDRQVGAFEPSLTTWSESAQRGFQAVDMIEVDGRRYYTWQEAIEQRVRAEEISLQALATTPREMPFAFDGIRAFEPLTDVAGKVAGILVRTRQSIAGALELRAGCVADSTWRLTVRIVNATPMRSPESIDRNTASLSALVSCHTVLTTRDGAFVSAMDPPAQLSAAAAECTNVGTWPVLVGEQGDRTTLLSSPIILYDYPQIASESPGDLFDGTEIDEILTLRILAMTDDEKREMVAVDERARALLERTERLAPEQLQKLHGTMRRLRPSPSPAAFDPHATPDVIEPPWEQLDAMPRLACLRVNGVELRVGDAVRLRPRGKADIFDMALSDKRATIESIERDFEDRVHVAVTVDDDPGKDLGTARMPGHRFFFAPDEVEPLVGREDRR